MSDSDQSGALSPSEMMELVRTSMGLDSSTLPDHDVNEVFALLDRDSSGSIDRQELMYYITEGPPWLDLFFIGDDPESIGIAEAVLHDEVIGRMKEAVPSELRHVVRSKMRAAAYQRGVVTHKDWQKLFGRMDKDQSGQIDLAELKRACRIQLKIAENELPERDITRLFKGLDFDRSGTVSFEELIMCLDLAGSA